MGLCHGTRFTGSRCEAVDAHRSQWARKGQKTADFRWTGDALQADRRRDAWLGAGWAGCAKPRFMTQARAGACMMQGAGGTGQGRGRGLE